MTLNEHLLSRHMDVRGYHAHLDETLGVATFMLFNLSGQMVGFQEYRPNGQKKFRQRNVNEDRSSAKYWSYVTGYVADKTKALAVWGLEKYNPNDEYLFVTEGVFDAVRLHNLGLSAVAVMANDPQRLRPWLYALPQKTVAVCDNDEGGRFLAKSAQKAIFCSGGKDLGEMSEENIREMMKEYL